jgi:hypothetical protein
MRPGDIIYHRPSREYLMIAWADEMRDLVQFVGQPERMATLSDCELVSLASFVVSERLRRELEHSCEPSD